MALNSKLVYMAYHFTLLRLILFDLQVDREGWEFEHSVSYLQVCLSADGAKKFPGPGHLRIKDKGSLTMTFTGKFVYVYDYVYIFD